MLKRMEGLQNMMNVTKNRILVFFFFGGGAKETGNDYIPY